MRTFIVTFVTLFALAFAWSPSNDVLNANSHADLTHHSDLQFFASSSSRHTSHTNLPPGEFFEGVPLPPSRNYILGPPKFPVNIILGIEKPYCSLNLTQFDTTCARACFDANACGSYYIFEGTNSGTPKLPYWYCYLLNTDLETDDFYYDVNANFAHAYNKIWIP